MIGVIVLFAGLIQLVAGLLKLGQWFRAVSPAVISGMLAGIGVLILASQFHVMLDYKPIGTGIQNLLGMPTSLMNAITDGGPHLQALGIGVLTIATIFGWSALAPKSWRLFPAPLVGAIVGIGAAAATRLHRHQVRDGAGQHLGGGDPPDRGKAVAHHRMAGARSAPSRSPSSPAPKRCLCATAVDQMHKGPRTKYDRELTRRASAIPFAASSACCQ